MSKKRIQSKRAARKRRQLWLYAVLALTGFAIIAGVLAIGTTESTNASVAPDYDPQDVAYDQPMHGIHEMGPAEVPISFLPADQPQPQIVVPQKFYDLGQVSASGEPEYTFVVRNEGEAPLTVSRIFTTCSCTQAHLTASVIPPGKIALLTLIFDPDYHSEAIGTTVQRGVIIESNDLNSSVSEVWIQAFVTPV